MLLKGRLTVNSYKDVYKYYMEQRLQSNRKDFVDEFIELEQEKVWDAYLSVDVSAKDGSEKVPEILLNKLKKATQFRALEEYFVECKEKEVYLTDDALELNEQHDLYTVLHAIFGRNVVIHLKVAKDKINDIEKYLEKASQEEASELWTIIKWKYIDDGYMIQLEKRVTRLETQIIRLYPDGTGVVVDISDEGYRTSYFEVPGQWLSIYQPVIERKVRDIISKPQYYSEDDRYQSFPVVLWYGAMSVDEDAYNILNEYQKYELLEFGNDEYNFKMIRSLLSIPEIKEIWKVTDWRD